MEPYKVIKYPVSTEKNIRLMEAENKLIFIVDTKATRNDVKKAIETLYKAKVDSVKIQTTLGKKKAYVRITADTPAIDVATQMGMM